MGVTRKHISRILTAERNASVVPNCFNFVNAAVVCAILDSISDLKASSVTAEPKHLKLDYIKLLSIYFDLCVATDVVFPLLLLSALPSSPFHCTLQDGFGQT